MTEEVNKNISSIGEHLEGVRDSINVIQKEINKMMLTPGIKQDMSECATFWVKEILKIQESCDLESKEAEVYKSLCSGVSHIMRVMSDSITKISERVDELTVKILKKE